MSHDPGARPVVLLGVAAGLALLLLEVGEAALGLGGMTGLIGLIPVALSLALGGPVAAGVTVLVALGGLAALVGGSAALAVALRHILPGLALGVVLARRARLAVSLMTVGAGSLSGVTLLVWAYSPGETTLLGLLRRQIEDHVAELERLPGSVSDPGVLAESTRLVANAIEVAGPAVLLVGLLLGALTNYVGARFLLRGGGFRPFAAEAVPDHLVWGVVTGGVLVLSRDDTATAVGLNLLIVLAALYAIQGLAVLRHFFQKGRVPRPLQGVSFGLFAVQPLLLIVVACLGLSDLWMDFRKIRQAPTPA